MFTAGPQRKRTGTLDWNDLTGKLPDSPIPFTGSYTVDATGRATLSNISDGSTFSYQLQFDLNGDAQGLVLSSDPAEMIAGQGFEQQAGAFSASSFNGSYGLSAVPASAVGPVTVASSGSDTLSGFVDFGAGPPDTCADRQRHCRLQRNLHRYPHRPRYRVRRQRRQFRLLSGG